jgi:cysteine sulfinate desulfinase/cysteine desulfurase-like protein
LCTLRFSFGRANQPGDGTQAAQRLVQILQSMPKRSL